MEELIEEPFELDYWVKSNLNYLPDEVRKAFIIQHTSLCKMQELIMDAESKIIKELRKFALRQYPGIKNDGSVSYEDFWVELFVLVFSNIALSTYKLIEDQKAGKKVADVFPDYSIFKQLDLQNKLPKEISKEAQPRNSTLSKKEWEKSRLIQIKRLNAFLKFWQKTLEKLFPEVKNFQSDENFIFNSLILSFYEDYKKELDYLQTLQDYGMEIPFDHMNQKELLKKIKTFSAAKQKEVRRIEDRRLVDN